MKYKRLFLLLAVMIVSFASNGQTENQKNNLQLAREAYSNKEYSLAIQHFNLYNQDFVKDSTLERNQLFIDSTLQYSYLDSYIKIEDWENAKKQIDIFYQYYSKSKSPLYFRVRDMDLTVERKMNEEDALYQNAIQNRSSRKIYDYLDDYP